MGNVDIVCFDLLFFLTDEKIEIQKIDQLAWNFDTAFFSELRYKQNPGNGRKFNTLDMKINLQSCPSTGEKVWQIWLMT